MGTPVESREANVTMAAFSAKSTIRQSSAIAKTTGIRVTLTSNTWNVAAAAAALNAIWLLLWRPCRRLTSLRNSRGSPDPRKASAPATAGPYTIPAARISGMDSESKNVPPSGTGRKSVTVMSPAQAASSTSLGSMAVHELTTSRVSPNRTGIVTPTSRRRTASGSLGGVRNVVDGARAEGARVTVAATPGPLPPGCPFPRWPRILGTEPTGLKKDKTTPGHLRGPQRLALGACPAGTMRA